LPAAKGDGVDAAGGEPVGVQPAVGNRAVGLAANAGHGLLRGQHARLVVSQLERFVIEPAGDRHLAAAAFDAAHLAGRFGESPRDRLQDFAAKFRVVAPGFGANLDAVGDDVGGLAAANYADVAGAVAAVLMDV